MRVVLISTYDMGRQPFGLASPAAWLRATGFEVECADVSRQPLRPESLGGVRLVGLFLPMHTATRLALRLLPELKRSAPDAHFCGYGLYAELHADQLRAAGLDSVLGGEFEASLTGLAQSLTGLPRAPAMSADIPRLSFRVPDRAALPGLDRYSRLEFGDGRRRIVGYTEASRGCKHHCRHCPIVPVYNGQFRVISTDVVVADVRQQIAAGAEHITFGDPDFFNGPTHAMRLVETLHAEFPALSHDVTIKVEHLLRHAPLLPRLSAAGCVLVTTAVESFDDAVLARLDKGHTRADFELALQLTQAAGLALNPTFVAFTPWITRATFIAMLTTIADLGLIERVAPVQYGIRLLVPSRSRLLELPDHVEWLGAWDAGALSYSWRHPDPTMDALAHDIQSAVAQMSKTGRSRREIFDVVWQLAAPGGVHAPHGAPARATIPYLNEPWFC